MSNLERCNILIDGHSMQCQEKAVIWYSHKFNSGCSFYGRCKDHRIPDLFIAKHGPNRLVFNTLEDAVAYQAMMEL